MTSATPEAAGEFVPAAASSHAAGEIAHAVHDFLALLTPWDVDVAKVRVGARRDGGYVLADRLDAGQPVLSFGVGHDVSFDLAMAERGHRVHLFDHTVAGPPAAHPGFVFVREGIAGTSRPEQALFSLGDHLARQGLGGDGMILKMDVEGAEWESIWGAPPEVLGCFHQIVVEVHALKAIGDGAFRRALAGVLEKLNASFTLFHVHANNYGDVAMVGGFPVVDILELSYVRTDLVERRASSTLYPTELDRANRPGEPDIALWFFPFAPLSVDRGELARAASRLERDRVEGLSEPQP